jgi:hypothetical protein
MLEEYTGQEVIEEISETMLDYGLDDSFVNAISNLAMSDDEAYELMIRWNKEIDDDDRLNLEDKMQQVLEKHNLQI